MEGNGIASTPLQIQAHVVAQLQIRGRVALQHGHGDTLETFRPIEPLVYLSNLFVSTGFDLLAESLGGSFDAARPSFIEIGDQGDYAGGVDIGARVPPLTSDTGVRNTIFRKAIQDYSFVGRVAAFKTILRSFEGNSTSINELALLSTDLRAYSHVVTPETAPLGPAIKIVKNKGLNALLVYELEFQPC